MPSILSITKSKLNKLWLTSLVQLLFHDKKKQLRFYCVLLAFFHNSFFGPRAKPEGLNLGRVKFFTRVSRRTRKLYSRPWNVFLSMKFYEFSNTTLRRNIVEQLVSDFSLVDWKRPSDSGKLLFQVINPNE